MEDIPDLLDELMAEGMTEDPQFASYVDAAMHRRALLRSFGRRRQALGVSQRTLATRMRTQQPAITRLERGESDPKLSTLERYASALGFDLDVTFVTRPERRSPEVVDGTHQTASDEPSVDSRIAVLSMKK
jgi:DNA-binding XRE family transcriptional regulator